MDENKVYTSFLGTGWGFPPTFTRGIDSVEMISDETDVHSSIEILLATTVGERVMQPQYGCNLKDMLFEPLNENLRTYFKTKIAEAILLYEPRVRLDDVGMQVFNEEGKVLINLNYRIITTNTRFNIVYPFYLKEGTEVKQ
jgi:phage baseplate assembly protein W